MVGENIADHLDASGRPTKDSEAHRQYEGFALVVTQVCVACFGVIVRIEQSSRNGNLYDSCVCTAYVLGPL